MLLDSNIIIYATKPEHDELRYFIEKQQPVVSAISYVEVLGYHKLEEEERAKLTQFFAASRILGISQSVLDRAVELRQQRKMSLGDSLIAGTALAHQLTLVTHNTTDFDWINGLTVLDPI